MELVMLNGPESSPRAGPTCSPVVGATGSCAGASATNIAKMRQSVAIRLIRSPQEQLVGVRPVNAHVTGGTALVFWVEHIVVGGCQVHAGEPRPFAAAVVALQA